MQYYIKCEKCDGKGCAHCGGSGEDPKSQDIADSNFPVKQLVSDACTLGDATRAIELSDFRELLLLSVTNEGHRKLLESAYAATFSVPNDASLERSALQGVVRRLATMTAWREQAREILVECDAELSAQAHGRPASSKADLLRVSGVCRRLYEGKM